MIKPKALGRMFEAEVLDKKNEWLVEPFQSCPVIGFDESVEMILSKQSDSWNPKNPPTNKAKDLLDAIKRGIRKEMEGFYLPWVSDLVSSGTGLYVALGTAADYFYQTDAIVCCDVGEVAPIVTIDLKLRDYGEELPRENHFVITPDHFNHRTPKGVRRLDIVSGLIAECLISQLREIGWIGAGRKVS